MASKKSGVHLDLQKNELQNAKIQNLSSAPGTPVEGQIYHNSSNHDTFIHNGSSFEKLLTEGDLLTDTGLSGASNSNVPTSSAIKTYVDNKVLGLTWGQAVRVASTANVNISNALENGDTLDGVTLATGDRVLLKDQSSATENGIYIVAASGAASRSSETGAQLANHAFFVQEGTANGDKSWTITNDTITLGSTSITVAQLSGGTTPTASTTTQGIVELATQAETIAKSDTTRAVTPSGLADFTRKYSADISSSSGATVSAATHGLGATKALLVQLYEDGSPNTILDADISVADNGDVTWATNAAITGHIVIIG